MSYWGRHPIQQTRRITTPRLPSKNSNSYDKVGADSGDLLSAGSPESRLNIVGGTGITTSGAEGSPDQLTISADGSAINIWYEDEFSPTNDQVSFSLTNSPTNTSSVFFVVNGVIYDDASDFSVSGQTITWTNALFNMASGDKVLVKYY